MKLPLSANDLLERAVLRFNLTNLNNERGTSTLVAGAASGTYSNPFPPRQFLVTASGDF